MKKQLLFFILLLVFQFNHAQVGINIDTPDGSSILDVYGSDKGLLVPRVNLISLTNIISPINSPATGLLVWNSNVSLGIGFYYFNGSSWVRFIKKSGLDGGYDQGGNGLGRTIIADAGSVRIDGTDGIMITGTYNSGALIDTDIAGAGTRMFFNPYKSSFRAGTVSGNFFNNGNIGNYSFATGYDNKIVGGRTFGANQLNETSNTNASSIGDSNVSYDNASFSSGNSTRSGGNNSFSTGFTTYAIGYNSFSSGQENRANTLNEFAIGYYAKTPAKTNSSGTLFVDSQSSFYTTDRAFVVGNGNSTTRSNAFEVWKDGKTTINSTYTLPTTTGTSAQILATNGSGTVSWKQSINKITQITLFADDSSFIMTNTGFNDLAGFDSAVIPTLFNASGNVMVKLVIRYTNLSGTPILRLRAHNGVAQTVPIPSGSISVTPTISGGVIESTWRNWNSATTPFEIHLSGYMSNLGESLTISQAYLLIKSQ